MRHQQFPKRIQFTGGKGLPETRKCSGPILAYAEGQLGQGVPEVSHGNRNVLLLPKNAPSLLFLPLSCCSASCLHGSRSHPRRPETPAKLLPRPAPPSPYPAVLEISLLQGHVPSASSQSNCEIIMVGDFNLNWMEKCCTTADSFAMDFHLTKLISQPTRLYLKVVIIHY